MFINESQRERKWTQECQICNVNSNKRQQALENTLFLWSFIHKPCLRPSEEKNCSLEKIVSSGTHRTACTTFYKMRSSQQRWCFCCHLSSWSILKLTTLCKVPILSSWNSLQLTTLCKVLIQSSWSILQLTTLCKVLIQYYWSILQLTTLCKVLIQS